MANHASTRTARLYDHRRDELSVDEVERIVIRGRITQKRRKAWLKSVVVGSVDGQKLEGQK